MPRYFFNVLEGHSKVLVRDTQGADFSSLDKARKEAIHLARDFAKHGFHKSMQAWELVIADENEHQVLTVPLCNIRTRRSRAWFDLVRRFGTFETAIHPVTFGWLLGTAMLGIIAQAAVKVGPVSKFIETYEFAPAHAEGAILIRFTPRASIADISKFLETYKASFVADPQLDGFYGLIIADTDMPQADVAKIVRQMAQETIVEFVSR